MSVIDDYLQTVDPIQRSQLERVRQVIHETAPQAEEVISYGIPAFRYDKKYLIGFASYKHHLSIFPASGPIVALKDKLSGFRLSRGTVQFTAERPVPDCIIKDLVESRLRTIATEHKPTPQTAAATK